MKIGGAFLLWIAAEGSFVYLFQAKLIQSQDFNISVLKYFVRSQSFRVGFLYWIVLTLLECGNGTCLSADVSNPGQIPGTARSFGDKKYQGFKANHRDGCGRRKSSRQEREKVLDFQKA